MCQLEWAVELISKIPAKDISSYIYTHIKRYYGDHRPFLFFNFFFSNFVSEIKGNYYYYYHG